MSPWPSTLVQSWEYTHTLPILPGLVSGLGLALASGSVLGLWFGVRVGVLELGSGLYLVCGCMVDYLRKFIGGGRSYPYPLLG